METTQGIEDWPEYFGGGAVTEIKGNSTFARGAFGEISLAIHRRPPAAAGDDRDDGAPAARWAAVKSLMQATVRSRGELRLNPDVVQELHALRTLNLHPNVVSLLALYSTAPGSLSLALDYCPTDLYLTLEWRRRTLLPLLSLATIQTIAQDVFAALQHCHCHSIAHLDIKPGNALVTSSGIIQLCDFGLAQCIAPSNDVDDNGTETMPRGLCTLAYRPPEVLLGGPSARPAADLWSAGVVLAELLTGRTPLFAGTNDLDQLSKIFDCLGTPSEAMARSLPHAQQLTFASKPARDLRELLPRSAETGDNNDDDDNVSCSLVDLLRRCIALDPTHRMNSAEAVNHAWLRRDGAASRATLREELLPPALDEPFLLLNSTSDTRGDDCDIAVARQQALALAKTRRTFLRDLEGWQEQ